jgi:hypothetical protein
MKKRMFSLSVLALVVCLVFAGCTQQSTDSPLANTNPDIRNEPSYAVKFTSIAEIPAFVIGVKNGYITNSNYDVKKIAANISSVASLPFAKDNVTIDGFGGNYAVDHNVLNIVYRIGDTRYRFVYSYDRSDPFVYEGTPILRDVTLDNISFDLYEGEENLAGEKSLYGSFYLDSTIVGITVYTKKKDLTAISFKPLTLGQVFDGTIME